MYKSNKVRCESTESDKTVKITYFLKNNSFKSLRKRSDNSVIAKADLSSISMSFFLFKDGIVPSKRNHNQNFQQICRKMFSYPLYKDIIFFYNTCTDKSCMAV